MCPNAERCTVWAPVMISATPPAARSCQLATIQQTNARLYRAYLLKEQLRQIYRVNADQAEQLLDGWLAWARRCRLPSFVKLARTITEQRDAILAAIQHGLSNARIEQITPRSASSPAARLDFTHRPH